MERALQLLPGDDVLSGARQHLFKALNEIKKVEKKRFRREEVRVTVEEEWRDKMQSFWQVSPDQAQQVMDNIDSMIEGEQKKIQQLNEKDSPQAPPDLLSD